MIDGISEQKRRRIEAKLEELRGKQTQEAVQHILDFNKTPAELKEAVDRFVIGQEKGKKIVATAIAFHYRRLGHALKEALDENRGDLEEALKNTRTPKANILIIGPTGVGKKRVKPAQPHQRRNPASAGRGYRTNCRCDSARPWALHGEPTVPICGLGWWVVKLVERALETAPPGAGRQNMMTGGLATACITSLMWSAHHALSACAFRTAG